MSSINRCLNCNTDYDIEVQGTICPHQLRLEGGCDSLPHWPKDTVKEWVEWVEPFFESEPVIMRVSRETAIKYQKLSAEKKGKEYVTDRDALDDFVIIHYATLKE